MSDDLRMICQTMLDALRCAEEVIQLQNCQLDEDTTYAKWEPMMAEFSEDWKPGLSKETQLCILRVCLRRKALRLVNEYGLEGRLG